MLPAFIAPSKSAKYSRNLAVVSGGDLAVTGTGSPDFGCEFRDADLWSDIGTPKLGNDNKPVLVELHTLSEAI